MIKKIFQVSSILLLAGFSFFYTEKVTKIARNSDPIMVQIKNVKEDLEVMGVDPIIIDDEYIAGVKGCTIDIDKSYSKMKSVGEYKEELLVMSEVESDKNSKNKYIVSGNKKTKNVSIIFIVKDEINMNIIKFLKSKNIVGNFFIDREYLEKNISNVIKISKQNNIYNYGNNGNYEDKHMIYDNNLINVNTTNESKYCLVEDRNEEVLNLCTEYDMDTIKSNFIKNNIFKNVKENLSNGSIMVFNSNDIEDIKVSINYILSKGYDIVSLNTLLNESNSCDNYN